MLYFVRRRDDYLKVNGKRFSLPEVEEAVEKALGKGKRKVCCVQVRDLTKLNYFSIRKSLMSRSRSRRPLRKRWPKEREKSAAFGGESTNRCFVSILIRFLTQEPLKLDLGVHA
jgi:hypothetical protein